MLTHKILIFHWKFMKYRKIIGKVCPNNRYKRSRLPIWHNSNYWNLHIRVTIYFDITTDLLYLLQRKLTTECTKVCPLSTQSYILLLKYHLCTNCHFFK